MKDHRWVESNQWCIVRPYHEDRSSRTFDDSNLTMSDSLTTLFKSSENYIDLSRPKNTSENDTLHCLPYQINRKAELINPNEVIEFGHLPECRNKFLAKDCRGIFITTKDGFWRVGVLESDLYDSYEEALEAFKKTSEFFVLKQKVKHFETNRDFLLSLIS